MATKSIYIRKEFFIERIVRNPWFWTISLILLFSYPLIRSINRELPNPPAKYFKIPEFKLVNENNKFFGSSNLKGRVYLASFIFTSCPSVCPKITADMKKIQKRVRGLGDKIALVSFSVDPTNDTPEVLFKYARDAGANPYIWTFLTGDIKEIKNLLNNGFRVAMGDKTKNSDDIIDIAHSQKIVLVDYDGDVRGYYSLDKESVNKLMIDVGLLVNKKHYQSDIKRI